MWGVKIYGKFFWHLCQLYVFFKDLNPITVYDGLYVLSNPDESGYPVYRNKEHESWTISLESNHQHWVFMDDLLLFGPMTDLQPTEQLYPVSHRNWFSLVNFAVIQDLPIPCYSNKFTCFESE